MNDKTRLITTVYNRNQDAALDDTLQGFTLTVVRGSESDYGAIYSFDARRVVIGRSHQADLLFHDQSISKQHCAIDVSDQENQSVFYLSDLGSTNGTRVNGLLIKENQRLSNGDKIDLGDTTLRFNTRDDLDSEYQEHLLKLATIDPLTALLNKVTLQKELDRQFQHAIRYGRPLTILMVDVDHFKRINDTHGHLLGDQVLAHIARQMSQNLRQHDIAGRFGGEEFTIILPETLTTGAMILAERIRETIETTPLDGEEILIKATVSIGIAELTPHHTSPFSLLDDADKALYRAKHSGRNQVKTALSTAP